MQDTHATPDPAQGSAGVSQAASLVTTRVVGVSWRVWVRLAVVAGILMLLVDAWAKVTALFQTLVIAAFMATAIDAVVRILQRRGMARKPAILTVFMSGLLLFVLVGVVAIPDLVRQGSHLVDQAPLIVDDIEQTSSWENLSEKTGMSDAILDKVKASAVKLPGIVINVVTAAIGSIFSFITLILAVLFLMLSGDSVTHLAVKLFPKLREDRPWDVVAGAYDNIGKYVIGATLQAMIAGVCSAVVLIIVGVDSWFILGFFTFLLNYIPLIGATIGAIPAIAVAYFQQGLWPMVAVLVFVVVYQQVENTIIQPRIQGKVVNLPAIAIFFSVLVGSSLFGLIGALFAVPFVSVLSIVLRHYFDYSGRDMSPPPHLFDEHGNVIRRREQVVDELEMVTEDASNN